MSEVKVSLSSVCGGDLEERFQELIPSIIASLREKQKGSVSIKIEFARIPDTTSMVSTTFTIVPRFPSNKKASICQINPEDYSLKTEAPIAKPKLVNMFDKAEGGNA